MTDSLFTGPTSQTRIRTLLAHEARKGRNDREKKLKESAGPDRNETISQCGAEVSVSITDLITGKALYKTSADDANPLANVAIDDPFGPSAPNMSERHTRFAHAVMLCSLISAQLENPANKVIRVQSDIFEYVDNDEEPTCVKHLIFAAKVSFNSHGIQENVELFDENGKVKTR